MALYTDLITILVAAVVISTYFDAAFGMKYIVGDSLNWTIPPQADFYNVWSASHSFYVGDTLVFNFVTEFHNVAQVPRQDYESCTSLNPLKILIKSPSLVALSQEGVYYYICQTYCSAGLKFSIVAHRHDYGFPPNISPSPLPQGQPFVPLSSPYSAPGPSQDGRTDDVSPCPVPNTPMEPPSMVTTNGNSDGVAGGMIFGLTCALCLWLLFMLV